jgi:hypothetical protein
MHTQEMQILAAARAAADAASAVADDLPHDPREALKALSLVSFAHSMTLLATELGS